MILDGHFKFVELRVGDGKAANLEKGRQDGQNVLLFGITLTMHEICVNRGRLSVSSSYYAITYYFVNPIRKNCILSFIHLWERNVRLMNEKDECGSERVNGARMSMMADAYGNGVRVTGRIK